VTSLAQSAQGQSTQGKTVSLDTVPLCDALGAEVRGIDLRQPQDAATAAALQAAWHESLVIVLRRQEISAEDQRRFCSFFGDVGKRARPAEARNEPVGAPEGMMFVSNLRVDGKQIGSLPDGEMHFHIDQCYIERPAMGTSLFALEVPSKGGDTLFSNLYAVYESLPAAVKNRIEGRKAVHFYDYNSMVRKTFEADREGVKNYAHPVVCTHPATGRKSLFVNRLMTGYIEGLEAQESEDILSLMFERIERPEFVYAHKWRPGDLLLWDNRCTAHARTDFDPAERRHLRRFTIQGDKPF
jgi:taurine dioxygenase